jgi:predicted anti-sigma-YlaC factor YlaD
MKLENDLTCAEVVEIVTEYLEGGLTVADRDRFEEHLAFCSSCLTYLDQMRETISGLADVRQEEPSPQLQADLIEAFRNWKARG